MQLLSYPSLVEAPFIYVEIGGKKFGVADVQGPLNIDFPNYADSIQVTKINGMLNSYTIHMKYQITMGDDPNYLDSIFASVGIGGIIKIGYGDSSYTDFVYKDEEALLIKITSDVDFSGSSISYTLEAQSKALALTASTKTFPPAYAKPSDMLKKLLNTPYYGLQDVFSGMNPQTVGNDLSKFIVSDDKVVQLEAKQTDVFTYMQYLVDSMESVSDNSSDIVNNSAYYLSINDTGEGSYFTVSKVSADATVNQSGVDYEIDVGFPGDTFVTGFSIDNDQSYQYLVDCAMSNKSTNYIYKLDNDGHMQTVYSPNLTTSSTKKVTTAEIKAWWTKVTKFNYEATLRIKGILKPALLISKVKLNVYFYGQKHTSCGLYIITKQVDEVNSSGFSTTLSLTKIGGA